MPKPKGRNRKARREAAAAAAASSPTAGAASTAEAGSNNLVAAGEEQQRRQRQRQEQLQRKKGAPVRAATDDSSDIKGLNPKGQGVGKGELERGGVSGEGVRLWMRWAAERLIQPPYGFSDASSRTKLREKDALISTAHHLARAQTYFAIFLYTTCSVFKSLVHYFRNYLKGGPGSSETVLSVRI